MNVGLPVCYLRFATLLLGLIASWPTPSIGAETSVEAAATRDEIVIALKGVTIPEVELVAMPPWTLPQPTEALTVLWKGTGSTREIRVPRRSGSRDLLFTPFALRNPQGGKLINSPQ